MMHGSTNTKFIEGHNLSQAGAGNITNNKYLFQLPQRATKYG